MNNTLYAADAVQMWLATRTKGVFSSDNDLILRPTTNMVVTLSVGQAWVKSDRFSNVGYANTEDLAFTIETADGMFTRIDRLVIRWDKSLNRVYAAIKKGTPASNPQPPVLQRDAEAYEMGLWDIRVRAGSLSITAGDIIDLRLNEDLCGIMRDGVTQIPTQQLYDAWWDWFSALRTDADTKASEFIAWMNLFRSQNEAEFAEFKQRYESQFQSFFTTLTSTAYQTVNDWFGGFSAEWNETLEEMQSTLSENQAANLFNKIDAHERLIINNAEVHGLRIRDGKFQADVGLGWATLARLPVGFTMDYFNAQSFTLDSFNARGYTLNTFNNQIRVEE